MVRVLFAGLIFIALLTCAQSNAHDKRHFGPITQVGTMSNPLIPESSGIAASRLHPNHFYTHNDSGDIARIFRITSSGVVQSETRLSGVSAVDWEDIAAATLSGKNYVFVADIGDNNENRGFVFVYRLEESASTGVVTTSNFKTYKLFYPNGPRNAETLMVDPKLGEIYIVTKVASGSSEIYRCKRPENSANIVLSKLGSVTLPLTGSASPRITGGDISPDGRFVVLRTLTNIYEYPTTRSVSDWFRFSPVVLAAGNDLQGEAVCYESTGAGLITTSEGIGTPIYRVSITAMQLFDR